ncbi:NAC domain-containing protein 21/22-like [Neltuma alba]|uniref:NAC domain-containing protein 21/22-like n=1 Tax=Neltuma alba TaxID=207710 RepID=UPI0010A31F9E|nr:NAC domain-containing protein 21/22-like [Prosopis alba]
MGLRDIGASLPPGFRFYPSDEELVCHYLYKKIVNEEILRGTLIEIDLHTCEPWQLPEVAKLNANEWYFFSFRDRKYATGFRTNRATTSGYWKATGKDRTVLDPMTREVVGMRKTLVFYRNRAPNGMKTGWIMHEFRLETPHMPPKEDWVLCRVFHKSRADNSSAKLSPRDMFETAPSFTFPCNSSPTTNQTEAPGFTAFTSMPPPDYQYQNQNGSLMNLLQFSRETNMASTVTQSIPKGDPIGYDDHGFLWDVDMEENSNHHNGVASVHLDGMRFDVDDDSMVVL